MLQYPLNPSPKEGIPMKRFFSLLFVVLMLLSLCACNNDTQITEPTEEVLCVAGHSWKDATCIFPKTCTVCKETEGKPLGHAYENGVCTVCGRKDPDDDFLTTGAWMYITRQGWRSVEFFVDGTCEIRSIAGMPQSGTTIEECINAAIPVVQRQYKDNWETAAKQKFFILKILDYYYCCEMKSESVKYTVQGDMIVLEQEGFLAQRYQIISRRKIAADVGGEEYVNFACTYFGSLLDNYIKYN